MIDQVKANKKQIPIYLCFLLFLYAKSLFVLYALYGSDKSILPFSFLALIPIVFLMSFSLLFKNRNRFLFLILVNGMISTLFFADIIYSRGFGHLISVLMVFATGLTGDLGGSITSLIHWTDFLLFLDLPLWIIWYVTKQRSLVTKRSLAGFLIIALFTATTMVGYSFYLHEYKLMDNYRKYPLLMSPLGNHLYDLGRITYEKNYKFTQGDKESIASWHLNNEKYMAGDEKYAALQGVFKGKNLIVVQVESLENVLIDLKYQGEEITPNINKLLPDSLYFSHVVEQVRDGNSSDAELMFNASMYPIANGSAFLRFGENSYQSMPKILKKSGYTSIALHGDGKEYWNRNVVFSHMGFDRYVDETQFDRQMLAESPQIGMGILDELLFRQSIQEIKKLKKPFNAFIITITSHMPFTMPPEYQRLDLEGDNTTTDYLQSIHYVDEAFGSFYRKLEEEGILEDSVLVLYGDHEGAHKYYPTDLPDNNREIPFIIHAPGLEGITIDNPGGQIDMMPTLLYLCGIEESQYATTAMGRNLLGGYTGSSILPTGELTYNGDEILHLKKALEISDLSIRGNYFHLIEGE